MTSWLFGRQLAEVILISLRSIRFVLYFCPIKFVECRVVVVVVVVVAVVTLWRRNEINIAGARRSPTGRNSKPNGLNQGPPVLGDGLTAPPHQLGGLRDSGAYKLPQCGPGQSPDRQ